MTKRALSCWISDDLKGQFDLIATRQGKTSSELLRELIDYCVENNGDIAAPPPKKQFQWLLKRQKVQDQMLGVLLQKSVGVEKSKELLQIFEAQASKAAAAHSEQ